MEAHTEPAVESTQPADPAFAPELLPIAEIFHSLIPDFNNPTHVVLVLVAAYFVARILFSLFSNNRPERFSMDKIAQETKDVPAMRNFSPRDLAEFNGSDENTPVYLAVKGVVYDVSRGRAFYGPGGPYANFAGRDASRGLALGSFDKDVLKDLDEPIDDLKGLEKAELDSLEEWAQFFAGKYTVVGHLSEPSEDAKKNE